MTKDEIANKMNRVFGELGLHCAYDMPSFWAKDKKGKRKYVVINDKYHKGYQQALNDVEERINEVFGIKKEAENDETG